MPALTRSLATPDADRVKALGLDYVIILIDILEWLIACPTNRLNKQQTSSDIQIIRKKLHSMYQTNERLINTQSIIRKVQIFAVDLLRHRTGHHLLAHMSELSIPFPYPQIRKALRRHLIPDLANLVFGGLYPRWELGEWMSGERAFGP